MKFFFHSDAELELNDHIDYYENLQSGLGYRFADEIYKTVDRIIQYPYAWQILKGDIRRALVYNFPFGVIYYIKDDTIIILAIMHLRKKPNYWTNRD